MNKSACLALLMAGAVFNAQAIQTAGSLLVNLSTASLAGLTNNATVTAWTNAAPELGVFVAGVTNAGAGPVYNTSVGGYPAVTFSGAGNAVLTNTVTPPAAICNSNDWSIEAWVFNPAFSTAVAEDVFSWTGRNAWPGGNANGAAMELRFGYDANAVEHYGTSYNVGWGSMPSANAWHHIAVTRNMLGVERVFADGKLVNIATPTACRIRTDGSFTLGATRDYVYTNSAAAWTNLFSGSIARLRVHDGALESAAVAENYLEERGSFGLSSAADSVWKGAAGAASDWSDTANWSGGVLPDSSSRVVIDNGGTAVVGTAVGAVARFFPYNGGLVMSNAAALTVPVAAGANVYMAYSPSNAFGFALREGVFAAPGASSQNLYIGNADTRADVSLGGGARPAILDVDRDLHIGASARAVVRMTMEPGGEMYVSNGWMYVGVGGSDAKLTMNGGLVSHRRSGLDFVVGNNGAHAVLEINGGRMAPSQNLVWSYNGNAATYAAVYLNGGSIEAYRLYPHTTSATNLIYLNGGAIRNRDSRTDFFQSLTAAYVQSGGAVFDVISNTAVSASQPLLTDAASLGGGVVKNGGGSLTLAGSNTFTGPIAINAGDLWFRHTNGLVAGYAGTITMAKGATVGYEKAGGVATLLGRIPNDSAGSVVLFGANAAENVDLSSRPYLGLGFHGSVNYTGVYTPYAGSATNQYVFAPQSGGNVYAQIIADNASVSSLTLNGGPAGTLELTTNNTFTGGTTINGGWLIMSHTNALGPAASAPDIGIYNGAALKLNAAGLPTNIVQRIKPDSYGVIVLGAACTNLSLDLTGLPGIIVGTDQGTLNYAGKIVPEANTYRLGGGRVTYTSDNPGLVLTNLTDGAGGAPRQAVIEGGIGVVRLAAGNSYSGGTVVTNDGALHLRDDGLGAVPASPDPDNIYVNRGVIRPGLASFTLSANRGVTVGPDGMILYPKSGYTATVLGDLSGSGAITNSDGGTVWLGGTNNTWGGLLSINSGTVGAGAGNTFSWNKSTLIRAVSGGGGNFGVNNNMDLTWSDKFIRPLGDLPQIDVVYPFGNSVNIGFRKLGTGTLTVDVNPSYTRDTSIENGTLKAGAAAAVPVGSGKGNVTVANQNYTPPAVLDVNGYNLGVNGLSGAGTVSNSAAGTAQLIAGSNNVSSTFFGKVAPNVTLTKTGTGTLTLNKGAVAKELRVEQGYVAASPDVAVTGTVTMAANGILRIGSNTNEVSGLNGEYYNFNNSALTWIPQVTNFNNLARINQVLAPYAPTLVVNSSPIGPTFDFSTNGVSKFQYGGANSADYEVGRWTGRFLAESAGVYGFATASDDSSMVFIDGVTVVSNNYSQGYSLTSGKRGGTVTLTAGWHDIVITWFDGTGDSGLTVFMTPPGGAEARLPQRLLRPNPVSLSRVEGSAYQAGIEFLSNNGMLTLNPGSDAVYAGRLSGTNAMQELRKVGAAAQTLQQADFTGVVTVAEGTLAVQGVGKMTGPMTVAAGATLSVRATSNSWPNVGLMGVYYDGSFDGSAFASLPTIASYFNPRVPSRILGSYSTGTGFNFGGSGTGFPPPYNNPTYGVNFQALYKGKLLVTDPGTYVFELESDDRSDLYIDTVQVITNATYNAIRSNGIYLAAGTHDVLLAYQQGGGGYKLIARMTPPGGTKADLPNAMLRPSPWEIGILTDRGSGAVDLAHAGSYLRVSQYTNQLFSGTFGGPNGAQVEKNGAAMLALGGNNDAFLGTWYLCQGELRAGNGGTSGTLGGSNVVTCLGTTLTFDRADDVTYAGEISGPGTVRSVGAGKLSLLGRASGFSGTLVVSSNQTLSMARMTATNALVSNGGTFGIAGGQALFSAARISGAGTTRLSEGGTLSLGLQDVNFPNTLAVSNGVLALAVTNSAQVWQLDRLTLAAGTVLEVVPSGLWGKYYDITYDSATVSNAFATYAAATNYFASKTPALVASTCERGDVVDFGRSDVGGAFFPGKYNSVSGSRTINFAAQYVGKIRITEPGLYTFGVASDDNGILYIDGQVVANGNFNKGILLKTGTVTLTAGLHDIAVFYAQGTGGYGLYLEITLPGDAASRRLPNAMLVGAAADTPAYTLAVDTVAVTNAPGAGTVAFSGPGKLTITDLWVDTGARLAVTGSVAVAGSSLSVAVSRQVPYGMTVVGDFTGTAAGLDLAGVTQTLSGTEGVLRYANKLLYVGRSSGAVLMLK